MSDQTIYVHVQVDADELRSWAQRHADAGNHGVAHVLYKAAEDVETLTEQALREAREAGRRELLADLRERMGRLEGVLRADLRGYASDRADGVALCLSLLHASPDARAHLALWHTNLPRSN